MRPALPYILEGDTARLYPGPHRSLATGPGHTGRGGIAAIILFHAAHAIWDTDLFAGFWDYDATRIDWLTGFLCDPDTTEWFATLAQPLEEEEEPEELFAKASMNTLGGESMNDD